MLSEGLTRGAAGAASDDNDNNNRNGGTTIEDESLLSWITARADCEMRKYHTRGMALK